MCSLLSISFVSAQVSPIAVPTPLPVQVMGVDTNSPSPCFGLRYTFSLRAKDTNTQGEVTLLQTFLQREGLLTVEASGYFGPATQKALKMYQQKNGISPTGSVGPLTRTMIKKKMCSAHISETPLSTIGSSSSVSAPAPQGDSLSLSGVRNTVSDQQLQKPSTVVSVPAPKQPAQAEPPLPSGYVSVMQGSGVPTVNYMSCQSPSVQGLANGKVGCYGVWGYENTFGDDSDMCPAQRYGQAGIGCKVKTTACESGQAFATTFIRPINLDIASPVLSKYAQALQTTPEIVKRQIPMLWEYTCTDYGLSTYGTK